MSLTKIVNGQRVQVSEEEENRLREKWAENVVRPEPVPDPTPLQIIEEMEARESAGQVPTLTAFIQAMTDVDRLKFTAAQGTISRTDRRIARFGQAFGMTPAEIMKFMDDAAARKTTEI